MMKEIILTLGGSILTALIVLVALSALKAEPTGSVVVGGGASLATTTGESADIPNLATLKTSGGSLGVVTITGAAAGDIFFYHATTTDNTLRKNVSTSSLIVAHIPDDNATVGTYIYDVVISRGLIMEIIGTQPTTTISYR